MPRLPAQSAPPGDFGQDQILRARSENPSDVVRLARRSVSSTQTQTEIVLLAADGESNTAIAGKVRVSCPTVIAWRNRHASKGIGGLDDDPRSGRPRSVDHRDVVAATLAPAPKKSW